MPEVVHSSLATPANMAYICYRTLLGVLTTPLITPIVFQIADRLTHPILMIPYLGLVYVVVKI